MRDFEIPGWDLVPLDARGSALDELDKLAPLFATPGWDPAWHRGLGEVFAEANPDLYTDERPVEPIPDEDLLRRCLPYMTDESRYGGATEALKCIIAEVDADRGRRDRP